MVFPNNVVALFVFCLRVVSECARRARHAHRFCGAVMCGAQFRPKSHSFRSPGWLCPPLIVKCNTLSLPNLTKLSPAPHTFWQPNRSTSLLAVGSKPSHCDGCHGVTRNRALAIAPCVFGNLGLAHLPATVPRLSASRNMLPPQFHTRFGLDSGFRPRSPGNRSPAVCISES